MFQFGTILLCEERLNKEMQQKITKQLPQTFTIENSPFTPQKLGITTPSPKTTHTKSVTYLVMTEEQQSP